MLTALDTFDSIQEGMVFWTRLAELGIDIVDLAFRADFTFQVFEVKVVRVDTGEALFSIPVLSIRLITCGLLFIMDSGLGVLMFEVD